MKTSFARLYQRAQHEVPLRMDLTSTQLLSMVSALPKDAATGLTQQPCLRVVLDGLRAQASSPERMGGQPGGPGGTPLTGQPGPGAV